MILQGTALCEWPECKEPWAGNVVGDGKNLARQTLLHCETHTTIMGYGKCKIKTNYCRLCEWDRGFSPRKNSQPMFARLCSRHLWNGALTSCRNAVVIPSEKIRWICLLCHTTRSTNRSRTLRAGRKQAHIVYILRNISDKSSNVSTPEANCYTEEKQQITFINAYAIIIMVTDRAY